MKKILSVCVMSLLLCVVTNMAHAADSQTITVSAALSLKNAFEEIGKLYESQNKNCKVMFNFGSSGQLLAQIKGGAPADVFASAAQKDMDELDTAGFVVNATKTDFAANSVVLIAPSSSKRALTSFNDLKKAEVEKIALGNPKTVPAGRYADEAFRYYKIVDMIQPKLVFAENVKQVLDYVARGEVDAGVVYSTDAMMKQQEVRIIMTAPDASHKPINYPIAVVKGTKNEKAAKSFMAFVASEEGRKILTKYGFKPIALAK